MKQAVGLITVCAVVFSVAAAWAEANPQPSPVNLALTSAQLQQINAARGDTTIVLTSAQIEKVKKTYANFTATTVTLSKSYVRSDNTIAIVVGSRGEANPQPSP
jgi:opacity protein-like surface antigen